MPDGLQPPYLDPSQYPAYLDLQRKQMLAQALMQHTMQSSQTPQDWDSMRIVPKRSALSTVSTLASALMARKANTDSLGAQQNYFQGLMGGGNSSPPAAASAPQTPPSAPSPLTGVLPPTASPPGASASSGVIPQTPQQPSPQQGASPMLLPGTDARTSQALLNMMGPAEYGKALAGQYAPTDLEKTLRAAGIPQNQWAPILRANIQKQNYIAPIEERKDSIERDPITNAVIGQNPSTPLGGVNFYDPRGNLTGQGMVPGATSAISASTAADTAGKVSQTPLEAGTDASGRKVYEFPHPPAMASAGGAQATRVGQPQQTASPAIVESQKSGAQAGQAYASELSKNATGATEVRRSLSELKNLSAQATPGAMNEGKMKLGSYMIAAGIDPPTAAKWLGVDVGALQAAQKQTATLAVNTIHSMTSRGTNFDLETFMRNNPNLNMSDPSAFQKVVDYMDNKSKQEVAKQKDFVQWKKGVSPDEWESGHTAHWLDQQNQDIDAGRSNSRPPLSSFVRP